MKWATTHAAMSSAVCAEGMLYAYDEKGMVHLVKADPGAFQEVSSFQVTQGAGEHWAHPTIANGRLYIRHGDALMAYEVSAQ